MERRTDGTLRQVASIKGYNWQKPQTLERVALGSFWDREGRIPTNEELQEELHSLATGDSEA